MQRTNAFYTQSPRLQNFPILGIPEIALQLESYSSLGMITNPRSGCPKRQQDTRHTCQPLHPTGCLLLLSP